MTPETNTPPPTPEAKPPMNFLGSLIKGLETIHDQLPDGEAKETKAGSPIVKFGLDQLEKRANAVKALGIGKEIDDEESEDEEEDEEETDASDKEPMYDFDKFSEAYKADKGEDAGTSRLGYMLYRISRMVSDMASEHSDGMITKMLKSIGVVDAANRVRESIECKKKKETKKGKDKEKSSQAGVKTEPEKSAPAKAAEPAATEPAAESPKSPAPAETEKQPEAPTAKPEEKIEEAELEDEAVPEATAPSEPEPQPETALPQNLTFDQLKQGVEIDGKKISVVQPATIMVGDKKWEIVGKRGTASGAEIVIDNAEMKNGALIVEVTGSQFIFSRKFSLKKTAEIPSEKVGSLVDWLTNKRESFQLLDEKDQDTGADLVYTA